MYREGEIGKPGTYTGTFGVFITDEKHDFVKDARNEQPRPYSETAVKRYYEPSVEPDRNMEEMHNIMMNTAEGRLGDADCVHVKEGVDEKDPKEIRMTETKKKEIRALKERELFRVILC